jgi:pimeloyl-ACP methyl ester carboxylesterase
MTPTRTPTSEFIDGNGTRLHYWRWQSAGPPLLMLHGNGHCGGVFAPLAEKLASDFTVYAIDLRGHGLSAKPETYSWGELRDDIVAMIEKLDLRDVLFASHSRGGGTSLLAAAAVPERVRGLVVYEPTLPPSLGRGDAASSPQRGGTSAMAEQALRRRSTFPGREAMFAHYHGRGAFARWRDEFLRAYVDHGAVESADGGVELACPPWVEARTYEAAPDATEWRKVKACPLPVLALFGDESGRLGEGRDPASVIKSMFPNTESRVFENATHYGPMEYPELFEEAVREFAAALPA